MILVDKKYKLRKDRTIEVNGKTLYQIEALRTFDEVKKGDLGGYIEKEDNLSHDGNCWVYPYAKVFDNARVEDNAAVIGFTRVYGNAKVFENAWVYDGAYVYDNAMVYGNAKVFKNSQISNDARIYDNARISENTKIYGKAEIYGNADITCNSEIYGNSQISGNVMFYRKHFNDYKNIGDTPFTELNKLKILSPDGYEIDKENSTSNCIKFKKKDKGKIKKVEKFYVVKNYLIVE